MLLASSLLAQWVNQWYAKGGRLKEEVQERRKTKERLVFFQTDNSVSDQIILFQPRPHYQRMTLIIWRRTHAMMNKRSRNGTGLWTNICFNQSKLPQNMSYPNLYMLNFERSFWHSEAPEPKSWNVHSLTIWWNFFMDGRGCKQDFFGWNLLRLIMEGVSSKTARTASWAKRRSLRCTQWSCLLGTLRWNYPKENII